MVDNSIGATLSRLSNSQAKFAFEIQFRNIQSTLINRFNKKVEKLEGKSSNAIEVTQLQKETTKLADSLPIIAAYREGLLGSASVLEDIQAKSVTLDSTLDSNTDGNVDADEVAAYIQLRDEISASLADLFIFVHPDIIDGGSITRLKNEAENLAAQTPVVGALTDAANVAVTDFNADLNNKVDTALASTIITISTALDLEQNIAADFALRDSKIIELVSVEQAKDNAKIDELRNELATFLKVISLSFEVNSSFADMITQGLSEQQPAPGSVLNLFT